MIIEFRYNVKSSILAAALTAAAFCTFENQSRAGTITFRGVVDEIVPNQGNLAHLKVGDMFSGTFLFNTRSSQPGIFGLCPITHYSISIGDLMFSGPKVPVSFDDFVLIILFPPPGLNDVGFQARLHALNPSPSYASAFLELELAARAPNGVIPPLDQFNLNDFDLALVAQTDPSGFPDSANGHFTTVPTFDLGNVNVPDSDSSVTLLSFGLLALLATGRSLRRRDAS